MLHSEVMLKVDRLKLDAFEGRIDTWYAYAEIDRLMKDLNKKEIKMVRNIKSKKNTKVLWLSDSELHVLAQGAVDSGMDLDKVLARLKASQYVVNGKQVYTRKFVAMYYEIVGSDDVAGFFK